MLSKIRYFIFLTIIFSLCAGAFAEDIYPFATAKAAKQFAIVTNEIRCVVCQNQTIGESDAPLAHDLRNKVYQMIVEKKSNAEIKSYLVKRYGEFILLKPPFKPATWLLWLFPLLGVLSAIHFEIGRAHV